MKIVLIVILVVAQCTGCIFVPFIDSYKSMGVVESDRQRLLQEKAQDFSRVRSWGEPLQVLEFATLEARPELHKQLPQKGKEKIVESEIILIDYKENSRKAVVTSRVKFFRVPVYVVEERVEKHNWAFHITDGWMLEQLSIEE